MEKLLQIHNMTKIFGEGTINEKTAISDLTLELSDGDFVTVIGNNGAGKSTLLNAIAGVFPVDRGSVLQLEELSFASQRYSFSTSRFPTSMLSSVFR